MRHHRSSSLRSDDESVGTSSSISRSSVLRKMQQPRGKHQNESNCSVRRLGWTLRVKVSSCMPWSTQEARGASIEVEVELELEGTAALASTLRASGIAFALVLSRSFAFEWWVAWMAAVMALGLEAAGMMLGMSVAWQGEVTRGSEEEEVTRGSEEEMTRGS